MGKDLLRVNFMGALQRLIVAVMLMTVPVVRPSLAGAALAPVGDNPCIGVCLFSVFMTGKVVR